MRAGKAILCLAWLLPGLCSAGLDQEGFIWQRTWDADVVASVRSIPTAMTRVVVLAAEATWRQQEFEVARSAPDVAALRERRIAVGLALRVNGFPRDDPNAVVRLADLAAAVLDKARAGGVEPAELQVDFDCPESGLERYARWLGVIRTRIAPTPLTFTALPCWLPHTAAFRRVADAADGFVLQVHGLESRTDAAPAICDTNAACAAVTRAARVGKPFRIALPTYSYEAILDARGRPIGFEAEGPPRAWPADATRREVRSDPAALAALVRAWQAAPPHFCTGLIWYRLPCAGDRLNWTWLTLRAVMAGRAPRPALAVETCRREAGLMDLIILNRGDAAFAAPVGITLRWPGDRRSLQAWDALGGLEAQPGETNAIRFSSRAFQLQPGQRRTIGWVRFHESTEVSLAIDTD